MPGRKGSGEHERRHGMEDLSIRHVEPADYEPVISVLNSWWGGRNMSDMLPRLFFVHFRGMSFVAQGAGGIAGFLIGFRSQTFPEEGYIHFAGVHPDERRKGIGSLLYGRFFQAASEQGCRIVHSVTSPVNRVSIAFHLRKGFHAEPGDGDIEGIAFTKGYDGPGNDRVVFSRVIAV
jgi:GNAT superfamily N-acetyltransferase